MLFIRNNPDGSIAETNYWQSEYNAHGLAYLSGHHLTLRLLLPADQAAQWLPEIQTADAVRIEPPILNGNPANIDIVFDDGTDTPFTVSIDQVKQLDRPLRSGKTQLAIYADGQQVLTLPCTIELTDAPRENYLTHATTNTGHSRRSYRTEIAADVMDIMQSWLPDLYNGQMRAIIGDVYAVRCSWHNSKAAGFVVSRLDHQMQPADIIKFAVCRHSKKAVSAWNFASGSGTPPRVPFVAAHIMDDNITSSDLGYIGMMADFERCLAWAWLEK